MAVFAPPALIPALASEASKRGVALEDANAILPPTRQYNEAEVRRAMAAHRIDGVLVVNVTGDTGASNNSMQAPLPTPISLAYRRATPHGYGQHDLRHRHVLRHGDDHSDPNLQVPPSRSFRSCAFLIHKRAASSGSEVVKFRLGAPLFTGDARLAPLSAASSILSDLQTKGLISGSSALIPISRVTRCQIPGIF